MNNYYWIENTHKLFLVHKETKQVLQTINVWEWDNCTTYKIEGSQVSFVDKGAAMKLCEDWPLEVVQLKSK